ncbi:MAG: Ig-like domain-containing protein, partial [Cyclobacteriaceae bacterium]
MRLICSFLFALVLCAMSFISKGQQVLILSDTLPDSIYVYDNFNIQGTTLIDSDNGFSGEGWNGSWSKVGDSVFVKSGTLNYPDSSNAVNSGLSVNKDSTGLKSTISRYLYDSYELADTATFYLSFLARKDSWGEFSLEGYGGTNLRYGVKVSAIGAVSVRASTAWSGESLAGTFKNDITYLVVIAKQGNTVRAALFQDGDSIPAEPSATTWVSEKTAATGVDMDRLVFTFDVGSVEIDEIKLGNTFKSVTNNNFWDSGLNAPTNLSLTPDTVSYSSASTSVTVSWNDNSLNEDGFDIYMDGQKLTSVGANITSYDLDTVLYGATANFQVRSFNSAGFSQRTDFKTLAVINESEIYLRYPEDSSTVYQTIPYFEWSHPKDQSFNGYFEIEIDDNLDFSSRIDVDTIPSFINYYVPDFELNTAVTYYWRLRYLDQSFTSNTAWSSINQFQIEGPEVIINVSPSDDWDGIRNKWFALLDSSETVSGAVELRFPIDGNLAITQDPNSDLNDRKNGFLLYNDGYDNIIVNGQGCTITLEATHGEENCGFMEVTNSTGVQVKDIIIDYHPNSTMQLGGVVQNFDVANRTFNVVVEPEIFETYDVLSHYNEGYFLTKERKQKIGEKGIAFEMEETWEEARTKDNLFQFTAKSGFNRYEDELKDGDYFVLSHRAGDIIYLDDNATNVVINGLTTYACRGRWFSCSPGTNARLVNNNYLAKEGRFMGSASGGIGADRGDNMWYENNRFEYSRDDMFHSGSNSGKGMVFRNNSLIGAYRNSIWVKADRTWVANNTIENSATSGIHIGYAPSTPGTMGKVILAENNIIKHSGWRGIHIDSDPGNADFETGSIYNENIYVRNNKIFDNIRDEAILIEYAKDAHIENNLIDNTDKSLGWSPYSIEDDQKGIYVKNSHGVHGGGNLVVDSRLNSSKLLLKDEETTTNITLTANGNITPDSLGEDRDLWVYDDFSITGDSLIDNGDSGYGWSGPWVYASGSSEDILLNDSVTLTYPSTSSSASLGGHIYKTSAGVTTIERALGTSYELHNTTQYFSLLAKKNSSGAFSVEGYGSSLLRYGLKVNTDGSMEARAANNWSSPALSGTFENDETYLVVLSREDDVNKLALFKAGETVPSDTVGVSWVTIGTGNTGVDMDTLNLVITSGEVAIDELRFGNSWQSVTQGSELVESVYPVSGATSVSVDSVISVGFLNSMDKNSTENAINIRPALDDAVYVWSASSLEIITRRLRDSTDYQVTIGHSAKTFDSIPLIGGYGFSFHTTNVAPSLDSIYPADEALGIPVSTDIVLNFSEPMDANSVETNLNFTPSLDNEQYSWSSDSSTLTITTDGLEYETTYSISLSVGASDIHGKGLNSALSYDFSTVANDLWVYDDFSITGDSLIDNGDSGYGWSGPWVYASGSSEDILLNDSVTLTYPSTSSSASLGG